MMLSRITAQKNSRTGKQATRTHDGTNSRCTKEGFTTRRVGYKVRSLRRKESVELAGAKEEVDLKNCKSNCYNLRNSLKWTSHTTRNAQSCKRMWPVSIDEYSNWNSINKNWKIYGGRGVDTRQGTTSRGQ
eukprot:scaffold12822_cov88-Cylindrotheca_fusiformis.AAC.2